MTEETIEQVNRIIETIPINDDNRDIIDEIKQAMSIGNDSRVLVLMNELQKSKRKNENEQGNDNKFEELDQNEDNKNYEDDEQYEDDGQYEDNKEHEDDEEYEYDGEYEYDENDEDNANEANTKSNTNSNEQEDKTVYPKQLSNFKLEKTYIGLLLNNPKSIVKYYVLYEDCFFEDPEMLNLYKSILFTDGGSYTPEVAKNGFNFPNMTEQVYKFKYEVKTDIKPYEHNMENVYVELMKLFTLRKNYLEIPIKEMQK